MTSLKQPFAIYPVSIKNSQFRNMSMTFNPIKTNSIMFAQYRLKIRKIIELFDFQSLMQHPLLANFEFLEVSNFCKKLFIKLLNFIRIFNENYVLLIDAINLKLLLINFIYIFLYIFFETLGILLYFQQINRSNHIQSNKKN